jgi:hypothetical protein
VFVKITSTKIVFVKITSTKIIFVKITSTKIVFVKITSTKKVKMVGGEVISNLEITPSRKLPSPKT